MTDSDGGSEYTRDQRLVLSSLERLEHSIERLERDMSDFKASTGKEFAEVKSDVKALKAISAFAGGVGGALSGFGIALLSVFKRP